MKRRFTLRGTLRSFLLLSMWVFLHPDANAQTYCSPTFNVGTGLSYTFNGITVSATQFTIPPLANNTTPAGQDFTGSTSFSVISGNAATVNITSANSSSGGALFVDWNKDGDFNDANEFIFSFSATNNATNAITAPINLPSGTYRMRLVATGNFAPPAGTACADFTSGTYAANVNGNGNYMDFTLTVNNPYSCFPPDSVTNYQLGASTAAFVWRPSIYITAQGYRWVIVAGGLPFNAPQVAAGSTTGSTASVAGLSPSNQYSFYVRSGCGSGVNDSSAWVGPLNFTTLGPQCTGLPTAVSVNASVVSVCYGSAVTLTATDPNTTVSGVTYQWQRSLTGSAPWSNVADGSGANTLSYTTGPITANTVYYRVSDQCSFNTGAGSATSGNTKVIDAQYNIPYFEDFSTTANGQIPNCYTKNVNPAYSSFSVRSDYTAADGTNIRSIRADFPSGTGNPPSPNNFFTLPGLNLAGGQQYAIRFNYSRSNTTYPAMLQVYVNNSLPSTTFVNGSPAVTTGTLLFDKSGANAITVNSVQQGLVYFTPPAPGTYYFSWYTNTPEAVSISTGTAVGVANINIYPNNACTYPTGQPTAFTSSTTINSVTGSFTVPLTGADEYLVVRTPANVPLSANPAAGTTYVPYATTALGHVGNGVVVFAGHHPPFIDTALLASTTYTYTIFAYNDLCSTGPLYDTVAPLVTTATTIGGGKTYVWNATTTADFQAATNWTPARYITDPSDILVFNNSISDTAINVPTTMISRLQISNNTTARLRPVSGTSAIITLRSDGDATTNELAINNGSSLFVDDQSSGLTINFSGAGATAYVAGWLEFVPNASYTELLDLTNAIGTIAATGTFAEGNSTTSTNTSITSSYSNLQVYGTINYRFTTSAPAAPSAHYQVGSTFLISGLTSATGGPNGNQGSAFYNVTWNCPNETAISNWSGTGPFTVLGTFTMISTGPSGVFQFTNGAGTYGYVVNNYVQTGGKIVMSSVNSTTSPVLFISGDFNQTGGVITTSDATATVPDIIAFNGTSGVQQVNFSTAPSTSTTTAAIQFRIMNPYGINLTGTGTATPNFNIGNNGSVRISSGATNPINTTLNLVYGTNSNLIYDSAAYMAPMTASVFPATNGPLNLTINVGSGNAVTMPFNRTVPGLLTLTAGDIDANSNTLTVGASTSQLGAISGNGLIRLTTGGLTRWFNSSGLPTSAQGQSTATGNGYFPVASGQANRAVSIYFNAAAPSGIHAGTITVTHNGLGGMTPYTLTTDGLASVNTRTNAYWAFTIGNSFASNGTFGIKATGGYLFTTTNPTNLTLVETNPPILGTRVNGSGTSPLAAAERTGITKAQLISNSFYIGADSNELVKTWTAINTGNWNTGSTWDMGIPPLITSPCVINAGVNVTTDNGNDVARSLVVNGTLTGSAGNTLTVDSVILNNGTINIATGTLTVNGGAVNLTNGITNSGVFNVSGGTVNLGPNGGGNKPFTNNGLLNITSGTLKINGNLNVVSNSYFNMSGGLLALDPNAAGVTANSVASGTHTVNFASNNIGWTGGKIMVIDPTPVNSTSTYAFVYSGSLALNNPPADTLQLGDGVSMDAGGSNGNPGGFILNPGSTKFDFGTIICASGDSVGGNLGTNRYVSFSQQGGLLGNLVVLNGGEFRPMGTNIDFCDSIVVNAGGYFTSSGTIIFAKYINNGSTLYPADPNQVVMGAGTFRNSTNASPTANFTSISLSSARPTFRLGTDPMNNPNPNTVSFSGTVTFNTSSFGTSSRIYMPNNTVLAEIAGAGISGAGQGTGWVVGTYQKHHNANGGINNPTIPVGDSLIYTPIQYNTSNAPSTGGDIQAHISVTPYPGISGSMLDPTKVIRRSFYVVPVNGIAWPAGTTAGAVFNFTPGDVSAGISYPKLIVGHDSTTTGAGPWTYPVPTVTPITSTTTQITLTNLPYLASSYVIGQPCPATSIVTQPASVTSCSGTDITFTAAATGLTLSYQWQKSVSGGPFADVPAATNATLTITNSSINDTGSYRLVITGICAAPVITDTALLSLTGAATITTQPISQSVCVGAPVSFGITAIGQEPVTYQWYKNWVPLPEQSITYSIAAAALADAGNITVTATNICGTDTSAVAVLTVNPLPVPTVTASGSLSICDGTNVVLMAPAGTGYTYQWYANAVNSVTTANDTVSTAGGYHVTITDANGCTATSTDDSVKVLTAPPAGISFLGTPSFCAGGNVSMVVTDTSSDYSYFWLHGDGSGNFVATAPSDNSYVYTSTTTDSFKVVVTNPIGCSDTSGIAYTNANPLPVPVIISRTALSICDGVCDSLIARPNDSTENVGGYTFTWYESGQALPATDSVYIACTSGSYSVQVTSPEGCSATSATTVLTVNARPVATATPEGPTTFCPGGSVVIDANAGTGYTYKWLYGNFTVGTTPSITATFAGIYKVVVTNASGCSDTSAGVTVTTDAATASITAGGPLAVCQGASVSMCANTVAGGSYLWEMNTGSNWFPAQPNSTTQCINASVAGQYRVTVTNSTGCSATSTAVTVTVLPVPAASATADGPTTFCQGGSVTLCTDATGNGYTYQWLRGLPFAPQTGATQTCYTASLSGTYAVVVRNSVGCKDTSAGIVVNAVAYPTATITPAGPTSICYGTQVALGANSGNGYTYQWQVDTGTGYYNIPAAQGGTAQVYSAGATGSYVVIVTNGTGCSTTSDPTTVFVNPLPVLHASGPTTFCWGSNITLSVDAGTGSGISYQWTNNGINIQGATGSTLFETQPGNYSVIVTVINSCSQNADTIAINVNPLPLPVIIGDAENNLSTGSFSAYQWYKDGAPINGATSATYNAAQSGDYRVLVTDANGCSSLSAVYSVAPLGINNVANVDVNIYPNPASSVIHIDAPVKVNVSIAGIDGKEVMQQNNAVTMDISKLANGVYMIRVTDKDGVVIKIQKLVKDGL